MSFITNTAVIFAVATVATLFTTSNTAPSAGLGDIRILPYNTFNPAGQIQQDSVPDPGIGDWFTSIFEGLTKTIGSNLKNADPKKIEEVRKYIKRTRSFVTPIANFIQQFYPNDVAASNVMKAIDSYLTSLEKMVEQPSISVSQEDVESLARLMEMLEAVKS